MSLTEWEVLNATLSVGRALYQQSVLIGDKIVLAGGWYSSRENYVVDVFDIRNETMINNGSEDLPYYAGMVSSHIIYSTFDNRIWAFGGYDCGCGTVIYSSEIFAPTTSPTTMPSIVPSKNPSTMPTDIPSNNPSSIPSHSPTAVPNSVMTTIRTVSTTASVGSTDSAPGSTDDTYTSNINTEPELATTAVDSSAEDATSTDASISAEDEENEENEVKQGNYVSRSYFTGVLTIICIIFGVIFCCMLVCIVVQWGYICAYIRGREKQTGDHNMEKQMQAIQNSGVASGGNHENTNHTLGVQSQAPVTSVNSNKTDGFAIDGDDHEDDIGHGIETANISGGEKDGNVDIKKITRINSGSNSGDDDDIHDIDEDSIHINITTNNVNRAPTSTGTIEGHADKGVHDIAMDEDDSVDDQDNDILYNN